jgi:hypothetical protein
MRTGGWRLGTAGGTADRHFVAHFAHRRGGAAAVVVAPLIWHVSIMTPLTQSVAHVRVRFSGQCVLDRGLCRNVPARVVVAMSSRRQVGWAGWAIHNKSRSISTSDLCV